MIFNFIYCFQTSFSSGKYQNGENINIINLITNKKNLKKIFKPSIKMNQNGGDIFSKKFISWLSDNNVYISSKSTWGRPPHPCLVSNETTDEGESSGRGLIAFKNIQQNEKIIEIPESVIITENNYLIQGENSNLLTEYDRIAIFLIQERAKGDKSIYKPYLDTLPLEDDLRLVFRWKFSDIAFLRGSKILSMESFIEVGSPTTLKCFKTLS